MSVARQAELFGYGAAGNGYLPDHYAQADGSGLGGALAVLNDAAAPAAAANPSAAVDCAYTLARSAADTHSPEEYSRLASLVKLTAAQ